MKTIETTKKPAAGKKAPKPITLTIDGELAGKVREAAKALGMSPANAAKIFVRTGEFSGRPTEKARQFRIECGLNELLNSGLVGIELSARCKGSANQPAFTQPSHLGGERLPVWLPADDVRFLREISEAADIQDGADGFVDGLVASILQDTLESTLRRRSGFPEILKDSYELENEARSMKAVHAVIDRWNAKGKEAA